MKNIFKLAWRNMFRNRRRTLIMIASVFFAVLFCLILMSLTNGSCDYIVDAIVERQTGTLQIMSPDYWDDKTVDNYMMIDDATLEQWEQVDNVKRISPRIESFAMAWNGKRTKGLAFIGIDPKRESEFSRLNQRVVEGNYLSQDDNGVMVGKKCAEILGLTVGDTITMLALGYQGESANGLFPVTGIVEAFDPNMDASIVYTSLACMQNFISMPNGASTISILLNNPKKIVQTTEELQSKINPEFISGQNSKLVFKPWQELVEGTMAGASENKKQMVVYLYFLYLIVGFGLFSLVIMLTNERRKEFGVMAALGTKKRLITGSLFFEIFFVALLGILAGVVIAIPLIAYYHYYPVQLAGEVADALTVYGLDPVMPFEFTLNLFVTQALIVFSMVVVVSVYPIAVIRKLKVIEAIQ